MGSPHSGQGIPGRNIPGMYPHSTHIEVVSSMLIVLTLQSVDPVKNPCCFIASMTWCKSHVSMTTLA